MMRLLRAIDRLLNDATRRRAPSLLDIPMRPMSAAWVTDTTEKGKR